MLILSWVVGVRGMVDAKSVLEILDFLQDSGGGRRSRDPPVLQVEREEAGTRATKREHSIKLAAPAGDEADSPNKVLASTPLGAKGCLSPSVAKLRGAVRLPASRARQRRPVVPSARPGQEARARGPTTDAV